MSAADLDRPGRRRAATVERLLDAALETFAEVGFAAATVEDVCRRGGFTRGAFYSSFRTKDELFAALYARETSRELARVEQQLAGIEAEDDPIAAAVARCLDTFRADRTWVLVHTEYALHAARHPEAAAALREHTGAVRARVARLVEDATARVGLRLTVPAEHLARMLLALHDGVVVSQVTDSATDTAAAGTDLERTALLLLLRSAVSG
ncbi:TetR/AcrR family transcriptional regulator [Geodermatophilus sp. TF02-6]|uniref:TetR/AcrR family transcriptional regulator n=1 Tax=Geodermatophilus sp. TF02-6 TaxID=2250575 RepID=UPI0013144101|nr:TetR/AcrR family transcriptional regulator [Geodermatophilus sp. TF02-6]